MKKEFLGLNTKGWTIFLGVVSIIGLFQMLIGYEVGFYPQYNWISFLIGLPAGLFASIVASRYQ